jgi:hypothetical protein
MENSNQNQDKKKTNKRKFFIFKKYENFDWNIEKNKFDRENNIGLDDVPEIEES